MQDYLLKALQLRRGNLRSTAAYLNMSRRHLYRFITFAGLWEFVFAARKTMPDTPLTRALAEQ